MFVTRLVSGISLLTILSIVLGSGGNTLWIFLNIISLIALYELYQAVGVCHRSLRLGGYLTSVLIWIVGYKSQWEYNLLSITMFLIILMGCYVFEYGKYNILEILIVFTSVLYIPVMFSYVYQIRMLNNGKYFVWLIFIGAWGTDTFAYCVGRLFGKNKLSPILSPKKTVEGAIGGMLGAILCGVLFAGFMKSNIDIRNNIYLYFGIICGLLSIVSMTGDLTASAIKRLYGIKDYGKLIPGHGGILDRFDSVLFVAPVLYLCLLLMY